MCSPNSGGDDVTVGPSSLQPKAETVGLSSLFAERGEPNLPMTDRLVGLEIVRVLRKDGLLE